MYAYDVDAEQGEVGGVGIMPALRTDHAVVLAVLQPQMERLWHGFANAEEIAVEIAKRPALCENAGDQGGIVADEIGLLPNHATLEVFGHATVFGIHEVGIRQQSQRRTVNGGIARRGDHVSTLEGFAHALESAPEKTSRRFTAAMSTPLWGTVLSPCSAPSSAAPSG